MDLITVSTTACYHPPHVVHWISSNVTDASCLITEKAEVGADAADGALRCTKNIKK